MEEQSELFEELAGRMDNQSETQIEGEGFIELLERSSNVSVRLSNAIRAAAAEQQLPYVTVEAYLAEGKLGRLRMTRLKNLGRKSLAELDLLIAETCQDQSMQTTNSQNNPPRKSTSTLLPEIGIAEVLENFFGVNPLLLKAIHSAVAAHSLPYQSIGAYLEAGEKARERMLAIEGFDIELLAELDQILSYSGLYCDTDIGGVTNRLSENASASHIASQPRDKELHSLSLEVFLEKQRSVSVRLLNAISNAVMKRTCPFETIGDFLRCPTRQRELRKIENLGSGTAAEFERLVVQALGAEATTSLWQNDHGYVDIGRIVKEAMSLLTTRQQHVIFGRFIENKTLEELASTRDVTRERVRQIEAKSLKILSTKFGSILLDSANNISSRLHEMGLHELPQATFSTLVTCENRESTLYLALLKEFDGHHPPLGIFLSNVFVCSHFIPRTTWEETVREEFNTQPLPLSLDRTIASISSVPGFYIRDYFQRNCGPKTNEGGAVVPRYKTSRMCIDVLRKAGRPLHTSEIRAHISSLCQIHVDEHTINATLGRKRDVLITAPGTYALYENLPFTQAQIELVRNITHAYLLKRGIYLSSKILFEKALSPHIDQFPDGLNHYLVLGCVQDDSRFNTTRGKMVGLATFNLSEAFTPLQDEVRRMVREHGPITIPEITKRLSNTRQLCNDSGIRLVLAQSPDVIRIGRRTFDSLHRFFETREAYDNLLLAIRVSLLEKKKTTFAITQHLGDLGFSKLTSHLVESLLQSMEDVKSESDIHEMVTSDDELVAYNDAVVYTLRAQETVDDVQTRLRMPISSQRLVKFISLDPRFRQDLASADAVEKDTVLGSILREFVF